jgi:dihydrofolate synthase / folylpolyglutamate synthase
VDHLLTSYGEAINALFARTTGNTRFGLERTELLLEKLGNPHRAFPSIHVAGTNGKGSVVATLDALLRATGRKVGRYTSPHLIDFRERITVNGSPITERAVLDFLERWISEAEKIGATFFELTTALAFQWFAAEKVDIAVIETGLGGRLDSTNVLLPVATTVTSIGLDHTDLLGDTLEKIAAEKAGIFKAGVPAIIGEPARAIQAQLVLAAEAAKASEVIVVDDAQELSGIKVSERGTTFTLIRKDVRTTLVTPLVGDFQARNTSIAIATLGALPEGFLVSSDALSAALEGVFLPGRFQRRGKFIFDVAHNPAGARVLADNLRLVRAPSPRVVLLAVLGDKDWKGIMTELAPEASSFVLTQAPSAPIERRWDPAAAYEFATAEGWDAVLEPELDTALNRAERYSGTVLVTGSFHTVGDVMSRLQVSPFAA